MGRISKPVNKHRKIKVTKVEEVNFDNDARHEYLTGFHKRKVQRAKAAQEVALLKAREEKRQDRKVMREERAAEFKRALEEHKKQLQLLRAEEGGSSDEEEEDSDGEWQGIEEPPPVDYEAEYIDEDKYTTVTVEEMDPSREGIRKSIHGDDSDVEDAKKAEAAKTAADAEAEKATKKRKKTTSSIKKKKKQFRYESKSDRKLNQVKQRINKNKKASARKEG